MEIQKTADTVLKKLTEGEALVFGLLTDSHYVVNGTWGDTLANINAVNDKVGFDGLIHWVICRMACWIRRCADVLQQSVFLICAIFVNLYTW